MNKNKFRKWNAEDNTMIDGNSLAFEEYAPLVDLLSQNAIMQYTGLTDKFGVPIYEGDITKSSDLDLDIVTFQNGGYFLVPINRNFSPEFIGDYREHVEVVGNIYEHSHLLEKSS